MATVIRLSDFVFLKQNRRRKFPESGKAIPVQGSAASEDSRRVRVPDFKTIDTLLTGRLYPSGNIPGTYFC
jgi:hypothetical protein